MLEAFVFITVPLLAWIIIIYNLLVRDKIRVQAGWSDINIQLKRRHDLIPKLVAAMKQYVAFESATLTTDLPPLALHQAAMVEAGNS